MSATSVPALTSSKPNSNTQAGNVERENPIAASSPQGTDYSGFVAGVFSGIAKLSVGHPFDTIKVRLQTSDHSQFKGPLDCLLKTIRSEGVNGLYKGATPPLLGWMCMDSLMLGSLTLYRGLLNEHVFQPLRAQPNSSARFLPDAEKKRLPAVGHGIAGIMAGWTVSLIAAPVEHVKARLQVQYHADKSHRLYSGPIDCTRKLYARHGIQGVYHGLFSTLIFRSFFFFWWGSYDICTRLLQNYTQLSTPAVNFWAGGLSAQIFWLFSYPSDVVKQRIMTDDLGPNRKFAHWRDAARTIYQERGIRGYWRGFVPCFLRAFPANAVALLAFESVMRAMKKTSQVLPEKD